MKKNSNRIYYILSLFIPIILAVLFLSINGFEPFGSLDVLSISGNEDMLTYLFKLSDYIHGAYKGNDIGSIWSVYLSDPTNYFICLFPKQAILGLVNIFFSLKLGLAGLSSFYLFKHTNYSVGSKTTSLNKNIIALMLSLSYALSGYMVGYGMNILFLSVVAIFPLYILFLNELITSGKWKKYYLTLCVSFILNVYMSFVVLIFSVLFLLLQNYNDLKSFLKTIYTKTLSDLLAVGTTAFLIIPAMNDAINSTFFCKDVPNSMNVTSFFDIFSRLLAVNVPSSYSDTAHGIDIYCGILPLLVVLFYALISDISIYDKIKKISLISILFVSTNILAPNIIFNFFKESNINICFFGFIFVLMILMLTQETLLHVISSDTGINISFIKIVISFFALIALFVASLMFSNSYLSTSPYLISIGFIFVYAITFILAANSPQVKKGLSICLFVITACEILFTSANSINLLSSQKTTYYQTSSYDYYVAENSIREVYPKANIVIYDPDDLSFNPIFNALNGVDFVLAKSEYEYPDSCLEYLSNVNDINIFRNNSSINSYVFMPSNTSNWVFSSTSPYLSSNELLNYAIGAKAPLFENIESAYADITEPVYDDAGKESTEIHDVTMAYKPEAAGAIYSSFLRPRYLGYVTEAEDSFTKIYDVTIKNSNSVEQTFNFYSFDIDSFSALLSQMATSDTDKYSQGTITNSENGYILLSIGRKPSEKLYIDGANVYPVSIDDYLWLAPISAGTHSLSTSADYSPLFTGLLLSVLAILLTFVRMNLTKNQSLKTFFDLSVKTKKKAYVFVQTYYVYIASVIFPIGIIILSCIFNSCIPFGKASIMASDGFVQTYPSVQAMIRTLSLKSLIPSKIGFGTLMFSCGYDIIASTINTVIQLLFRLFIWTDNGMAYAAIQSAFYMIISGPALIFYLTHRYAGKQFELNNPYLILISLFYTLSEYMIGYFVYSNFVYGLFIPMIIWGFERMFYKKKPLAYIFILAYIMIRGYYTAFLLCEFLGIYFILQQFDSINDFLRKGIRFALSSILAAGISISTLLPAFISTQNATYILDDSNVSSSSFSLSSSIFKTISQYKACHYGIIATGDDYLVNYYAGLIPLLFCIIYLCNNNISRSVRIRKAVVSFIFIYAFGNSFMNYVFHGFHFQSNVPNRFALFFIFLMLTMFADTILDINEINKKRLIIPSITTSVVLITIWLIYPEENLYSLIISIIFIIAYNAIILVKNFDRKSMTKIITYVSVAEIVLSSLLAFSSCIGYRNQLLNNNVKTIQSLCNEYINKSEDDIYIAEYLTSSEYNLNMGRVTGQNTITGFQSGMSNQLCSMSANWGVFSTNNYINYGTGNPLADMMLHVRYQFLDTDDAEYGRASIYNKLVSYNNFDLYENPYFLPIGFMTNSDFGDFATMNKADFDTMIEYQNTFSQKVCGKDLYTSIGSSRGSTSADQSFNMAVVSNDSNVYGNYDLGISLELGDITGKIYALYKGEIKYIGDTETAIDNSFYFTLYNYPYSSFDEGSVIDIAVLNENVLKELYETFSKSTLNDISVSRDSISGSINVSESGMMYIGLPNYDSLIIYIDGKKADKSDYLMGTGIQLDQGQHQVLIRYEDNSYTLLIALTALFILVSIIICKTVYSRKNKDE